MDPQQRVVLEVGFSGRRPGFFLGGLVALDGLPEVLLLLLRI